MNKHILAGADIIMSDDLQQRLDEASLYDEVPADAEALTRKSRLLPRLELSFAGESVMHSFECLDLVMERQPGIGFFSEWTVTFAVKEPMILAKAMQCKFQGTGQIVVGDEVIHEFSDLNERVKAVSVGQALEGVTVTYVAAI